MTAHNYDSGMFKTGDLVIGTSDPSKSVYSASGAKINSSGSSIYGSEADLDAHQKEITDSILRNGGKKIQTAVGKNTKKKEIKKNRNTSWPPIKPENSPIMEYGYIPEPPKIATEISLTTVQFENAFGKMKAKVENIVEHEQAFMLVFRNEDDVVFEPKIGETLALYDHYRNRHEVYYPGVTFDWPVSDKKIMILFKVPSENQE